jgi:hypothetical protein
MPREVINGSASHSLPIYQINIRIWLPELSRGLNRPSTLDDIPDTELGRAWHGSPPPSCFSDLL